MLLAIDAYSELVYFQTLLKKVGFDVDGIQNTRNFEEVRLTFNPDLLIASAKGKNINGLSIMEKMKRRGGRPKSILIIPTALAAKLSGLKLKNVEATVPSPVEAEVILSTIADVLERDKQALLDKYERAKANLDPDNDNDVHLMRSTYDQEAHRAGAARETEATQDAVVSGGNVEELPSPFDGRDYSKDTSITPDERKRRMQKWLLSMKEPEQDGFPRDVVKLENKRLREEEDEEGLHDLEEERRAFVRSMFKKKD